MTVIDLSILGVLLLSAGISFVRGLAREVLSLLTWIVAMWIAISFMTRVAVLLAPYIDVEPFRLAAAFLLLFITVLILGALFNHLVAQLIKTTGLSGTDRMGGVVFGLARGVLVVSVLVILAGVTPMPGQSWWQESSLLPQFQQLAGWMMESLPGEFSGSFDYRQTNYRFAGS